MGDLSAESKQGGEQSTFWDRDGMGESLGGQDAGFDARRLVSEGRKA